jgi:hypothetical protein
MSAIPAATPNVAAFTSFADTINGNLSPNCDGYLNLWPRSWGCCFETAELRLSRDRFSPLQSGADALLERSKEFPIGFFGRFSTPKVDLKEKSA